jgi:hypothetical protein
MKHLTDKQRAAVAQKLREIADILAPVTFTTQDDGGGNGNGPPLPGGGNGNGPPGTP